MQQPKRIAIVALTLVGLIAGSGVALAADGDVEVVEDASDSDSIATDIFNFGYDLVTRIFVWNLTPTDGVYDCTLEGEYQATYGEASEDGVIPIEDLEDENGVVSFPNRPEDEVADDLEPADEPIDYAGAEGDCGLTGAEVTGPQGQVNHGMFLKLLNNLWNGPGRGCVVRHLAQSDLGKGEQQVRTGEDPDFESVEPGDIGTVDFTSIQTTCQSGEKGNGSGEGTGKPDWAGKPDNAGKPDAAGRPESPGKSGSAPGQNK